MTTARALLKRSARDIAAGLLEVAKGTSPSIFAAISSCG